MYFLELNTNEKRKEYEQYMLKISEKYPKTILKLFKECGRFHDYYLANFSFSRDDVIYRNDHDKVTLTLFSDICRSEDYLVLEFCKIEHLSFDTDFLGNYKEFFLNSIYYAELGIVSSGNFTFELLVSDGPRLYFEFQKCKVLKRKKPRFFLGG